MAETLFDENMGGPFGNTHIAVGSSYHDTFTDSTVNVPKSIFKKLGYNESVIHVDMISTTDRTVTATLPGGRQKVIYQKGQFTV
jgi:aminopeptidase